jgi:predicted small lipoprotein YifL
MRTAIVSLAALCAVAAIASCGKEGELERPGPVFDHAKEKAAVAEQQREQAETATNATEAGKPIGPQNPAVQPYTNTAPPRDLPIPGEPTYPSTAPEQGGVAPNPM